MPLILLPGPSTTPRFATAPSLRCADNLSSTPSGHERLVSVQGPGRTFSPVRLGEFRVHFQSTNVTRLQNSTRPRRRGFAQL